MWRETAPAALEASFRAARPFPHAVHHGFLETGRARELAACFPDAAGMRRGTSYETADEHAKIGLGDRRYFPAPLRELAEELESAEFLQWLSAATGIPGLVGDPLLLGGGLHRMAGDGRLGQHIDFSESSIHGQRYYRRLNLLLFLNPEWRSEWGGQLELWPENGDPKGAVLINPELNLAAVFETSHTSWHGVGPLAAPVPRCSFAAYFFTADPPIGYRGLIPSTIFRKRPALA